MIGVYPANTIDTDWHLSCPVVDYPYNSYLPPNDGTKNTFVSIIILVLLLLLNNT